MGLVGLTSTRHPRPSGTSSLQQLQPLRRKLSEQSDVTPVMLPPGRLRLATSPSSTGSPSMQNTIGIVVVAALAASAAEGAARTITSTWRTNQIGRQMPASDLVASSAQRYSIATLRPSTTGFAQAPAECAAIGRVRGVPRRCRDNPTHRHRRLLRPRRERPRRRRAAEQRDELAPFHCLMPPVLPTERIAHLGYGRRLLRCGISIQPMSQLGQTAKDSH